MHLGDVHRKSFAFEGTHVNIVKNNDTCSNEKETFDVSFLTCLKVHPCVFCKSFKGERIRKQGLITRNIKLT